MSLPSDQPPTSPPAKPKLTLEERRARQADRLTTIRLRMLIGRELEDRGVTTPTAIGAALGMPPADSASVARRRCGAAAGCGDAVGGARAGLITGPDAFGLTAPCGCIATCHRQIRFGFRPTAMAGLVDHVRQIAFGRRSGSCATSGGM